MHTLRRCLTFLLLLFFLCFGSAVQRNRAADNAIVTSYLPLAMREDDSLTSLGPDGGSIVVMEMDPNNTNILYAGTWGSGMYKSMDGGVSWQVISQGLPYLYINSLAMDPQNPLILYAGTYEHGVYKTTDGGATWAATGPGLSAIPIVYTIAVDPVTPNVVYCGTRNQQDGPPWGGGLYKTTNGGETWVKSKLGIPEEWVYDIKIDPTDHGTLYAATHSKGVYKSVSAGSYWEAVNNGITDLSTRSIVIDPTNPEIIYVGTWHYGGVFKTVNGGDSWKAASSGLYHKIYSLHMDPKNSSRIYAATYRKGIMVTENAGTNWHNTGLYPDMVYNVMIDPHDTKILYAGTMGDGFFKSADRGEFWWGTNAGFKAANVTGLVADWTTPITGTVSAVDNEVEANAGVDAVYASAYGGGIYKTTDLGQSWQRVNSGLGESWVHALAISNVDPQTLYAGTDATGFFISTDGGASWTAGNNGLPEPPEAGVTFDEWTDPLLRPDVFDQAFFEGIPDQDPSAVEVTKIVSILSIGIDSFDPNIVFVGTEGLGIYKSQNGGVHWALTKLKTHIVYAILSDPFTPGYFYAGCDGASNTLFRSVDGGISWTLKNVGMAGLTVYALAADPFTPGTLYAGTSQGIYISSDNAETWVPFGLPGYSILSLGLSPAAPGTIYGGTTSGLYISHDYGVTWKPMNTGLVNLEISHIALDPAGMPLINLISTRAGGVFTHTYTP